MVHFTHLRFIRQECRAFGPLHSCLTIENAPRAPRCSLQILLTFRNDPLIFAHPCSSALRSSLRLSLRLIRRIRSPFGPPKEYLRPTSLPSGDPSGHPSVRCVPSVHLRCTFGCSAFGRRHISLFALGRLSFDGPSAHLMFGSSARKRG